MHYHTLAAGDETLINRYSETYKAQLFAAGNHRFRVRRNYRAALAAYLAAKRFGLDNYESNIRIASCLMRVGRRAESEAEYERLIGLYPHARGLKTSYIDSQLYVRDFAQALAKLNEFGFRPTDDPWIAHEFGRSHLGLHQYKQAIQAFEVEIRQKPEPVGYILLAQAYFRSGDLVGADRTSASQCVASRTIVAYSSRMRLISNGSARPKVLREHCQSSKNCTATIPPMRAFYIN